MQKTKHLIAFFIFLVPALTFAQSKKNFTVSGTIKDKSSGETLPGATVSFLSLPGIGASSNAYGFYSVTVPAGTYNLVVTYTGFRSDTMQVTVDKNLVNNFALSSTAGELQEVTIKSSSGKSHNILTTPAGVQRMTIEDIKNVPVLLGEKDVMKTIQLLPGIVSAGDGKSGFHVRGGDVNQNLILLDEATVYNASHLLGIFSAFNSDAIKDIDVYKGGMPASYGGRLSSIEDIHMNDGNDKKYVVSGGLGLIASRLTVQGPIVKDKGSFIISARRTYADLFTGLSKDTTTKKTQLYFYDFNVKANYQINKNNRVYLSGYFGQDVLRVGSGSGINYGNTTATFRWNHIFSSRLFSNTSLIYSNFNYDVDLTSDNSSTTTIGSGILDYHLKQDFTYYLNSNNKFNFGLQVIDHNAQPGNAISTNNSSFNNINLQRKYSLESALYASHEWTPNDKLKIVYGLRVSDLSVLGPGTFYSYDSNGNTINQSYHGGGSVVKTYINPEPRLAVSYQLNDSSSIKLAYDRNVQNVHLITNSSTTSPTSVYLPSSNNIKPEIADQISLGYYRTFHNNGIEFSSEIYYKGLQNQIDYKNGANLVGNENVEAQLLYGPGRAYGWETYVKKKYGRFTGWVSFTLSRTERKIKGINNDQYYPATQDEPVHFSVVGLYQASKRWTLSADFVYNTGNATTWPNGKFDVLGAPVYSYNSRNGNRTPAYNRLDIGATLMVKKTPKVESSWNFSIYNVMGVSNPYTIGFQSDPINPNKTEVKQTTLFSIIPSVTYNFKF